MAFKKAERKQVKVKLAITGPSGSGKTYSALLIAAGLGGKIAVLDTENDSASLYAGAPGIPEFDTETIGAPFSTEKYVKAIKDAVLGGYNVLVIDSVSHQWSGEGGILDRKDKEQLANPKANSFTLWAKYTPEHEQFKAAINQADLHIIATMRSKQDYVLEQNDRGRQTPKKVGTAPIQREGAEYEYTVVFDMSMENYASASKDRTGLFAGKHFKPTVETGKEILDWLLSGKASRQQEIGAAVDETKWPKGSVAKFMQQAYGTAKISELSEAQFVDLLARVKGQTFNQAHQEYQQASKPAPVPTALQPGDFGADEVGAAG